jgi:hypothetical protein
MYQGTPPTFMAEFLSWFQAYDEELGPGKFGN